MSDLLVRLFGWRATLVHGDPLVYDRWRWINRRLRKTKNAAGQLQILVAGGFSNDFGDYVTVIEAYAP